MARSNGYSASEIMAMQRDAAERVREMQRRARQRMEQGNPPAPPVALHTPPPSMQQTSPLPGQFPPSNQLPGQPQAVGLLQSLLQDSDRILLLILLLVLYQEKADPALMLALAWLMM